MELNRLTGTAVLLWVGALSASAPGERPGRESVAATGFGLVYDGRILFNLLTFFAERNLFAPPLNGQGCEAAGCGMRPLPDEEVPGLLAYVRKQ